MPHLLFAFFVEFEQRTPVENWDRTSGYPTSFTPIQVQDFLETGVFPILLPG